MHRPSAERSSRSVIWFVALAMGAGLQCALTVHLGGVPLRIVATDAVLPLALGALAISWWRDGRPAIGVRLPGLHFWLAALTAVILLSILIGRFEIGNWSAWAVVNRGIGWFVLLGYLAAGVLLRTLGDDRELAGFVGSFALTTASAALSSFILMLLFVLGYDLIPSSYAKYRATGFFQNPNAFGIVCVVATGLLLSFVSAKRSPFGPSATTACLGLSLLGIFISQSRSAWIALAASAIGALCLMQIRWKPVFLALVIASAGTALVSTQVGRQTWAGVASTVLQTLAESPPDSASVPTPYVGNLHVDTGIEHRLSTTQEAVELWRRSPILGIGMGSFYQHQTDKNGPENAATIHTTALWLLTETGLFGASLFLLFGLASLRALLVPHLAAREPIVGGVALALIAAVAASVGTEMLYQRYVWFLLGLGIALATAEREAGAHIIRAGELRGSAGSS